MSGSVYIDTSVLAKYYLNERRSSDAQAYLQGQSARHIGKLVAVEFRCLLARRRRLGMLDSATESRLHALFLGHLGLGLWDVRPMDGAIFDAAVALIARLKNRPIRTLDALHLAAAELAGADALATADRGMADAARAIGLKPVFFG